jgi:hypothetical protein
MNLTSVQRRIIAEQQSIKADILRDWIDKLREAFDRTMFFRNFIEGLADPALAEYAHEHPEDQARVDAIRDPIRKLIAQSQLVNKLLIDIDQRIGKSESAERHTGPVPSPEEGAEPEAEGAASETPAAEAPEAAPAEEGE